MNAYKLLKKYQLDWIKDDSRFKLWLKSRQIGGSLAAAWECVENCFIKASTTWIILSRSDDQSKEFLRTAGKICRILHATYLAAGSDEHKTEPTVTASEIRFFNQSRIIARPANDKTARGYSGNLVLDEFAFHQDPDEIWQAVFPIITNTLNGELKLRVISTPNGKNNMFHDIWATAQDWSRHRTTIHDAKSMGLNINIEDLKQKIGDEKKWAQEYECEFIDNIGTPIIEVRYVEDAMNKTINPTFGNAVAFCDFAAGGDENALAVMVGRDIVALDSWVSRNTIENVEKFVNLFNKYREMYHLHSRLIFGDEGGMGGIAMCDQLSRHGWSINRVQNGAAAYESSNFANHGAEIWYTACREIMKGDIRLPKDNTLLAQLTSRQSVFDERGRIKLQSKKDLSKSPDRADAVCGAIYYSLIQGQFFSPKDVYMEHAGWLSDPNDEAPPSNMLGFWAGN